MVGEETIVPLWLSYDFEGPASPWNSPPPAQLPTVRVDLQRGCAFRGLSHPEVLSIHTASPHPAPCPCGTAPQPPNMGQILPSKWGRWAGHLASGSPGHHLPPEEKLSAQSTPAPAPSLVGAQDGVGRGRWARQSDLIQLVEYSGLMALLRD